MDQRIGTVKGLMILLALMLSGLTAPAQQGAVPISQADIPFYILEPGSYILTESVTSPGGIGPIIRSYATNVTVDLNGYTVSGSGAAFETGILLNEGSVLKNGCIRGVGRYAIFADNYNIIKNIHINDCGQALSGGEGNMLISCSVSSNSPTDLGGQLRLDDASMVSDLQMQYGSGIDPTEDILLVRNGSLIHNSRIRGFSHTGTLYTAVFAGNGSLVQGCSVSQIESPQVRGYFAASGSLMTGCEAVSLTSSSSGGSGISISFHTLLLRNRVSGLASSTFTAKGYSTTGASMLMDCIASSIDGGGISIFGPGRAVNNQVTMCSGIGYEMFHQSTLRNNYASGNGTGYYLRNNDSLLLRNTAHQNTSDYIFQPGTTSTYARVVTDPGWLFTLNTNTWANIRY